MQSSLVKHIHDASGLPPGDGKPFIVTVTTHDVQHWQSAKQLSGGARMTTGAHYAFWRSIETSNRRSTTVAATLGIERRLAAQLVISKASFAVIEAHFVNQPCSAAAHSCRCQRVRDRGH
ncbi:hypothetical protein GCM10012319_36590 [Comamonas sp. KCTC 72670]|nr:hypothetical protein GCM10012319_36590 [Comamonas sp. KCTC 72670]